MMKSKKELDKQTPKSSQSGRSIGQLLKGKPKGGSRTAGGYHGSALKPRGKARFPNGKYRTGTVE